MACCYIAAYCVGQLVKASQFFDLDNGIRYNDEVGIETFITDLDNGSEKATVPKPPAADGSSFVVSIDGMTCSACTSAVEDTVGKINGVDSIRVSLPLQQATIVSKVGRIVDSNSVIKAITDLGYDATLGPRKPRQVLQLLNAKEHISGLADCISKLVHIVGVLQVSLLGKHGLLTWTHSRIAECSDSGHSLLYPDPTGAMASQRRLGLGQLGEADVRPWHSQWWRCCQHEHAHFTVYRPGPRTLTVRFYLWWRIYIIESQLYDRWSHPGRGVWSIP